MNFPKISTAIPQQRYRLGDYLVTLLGDIESPDAADYRYLMAYIKDGEQQPSVYVSCERAMGEQRQQGRYQIRVINRSLDEVMGASDELAKSDVFSDQALDLGRQLLGLQEEQAYPLT